MRRLLFLLFFPLALFAQTSQDGRVMEGPIAVRPTICAPLDLFGAIDTNSLYQCGPVNTWSLLANGGIPNTPLPFAVSMAFSAASNSSYSTTLTANLTTILITGSPVNGVILRFVFTEGGAGGFTPTWPGSFIIPPGFTFSTSAGAVNYSVFLFDGTNWTVLSSTSTGGGTGCAVSGVLGDLQMFGPGSICSASHINDSGTNISVSENMALRGPNPMGVDVTSPAFGARFVNNNSGIPNTTCTISSGSPTATFGAIGPPNFLIGDGVTCQGAGATQLLTTPPAPTVTPSTDSCLSNVGCEVASPLGSTTYVYRLEAVDNHGGVSAAGAITTITNGQATLGAQTTTINGTITAAANVFTYPVTSVAGLVAGQKVRVKGTSDDPEFAGDFVITSVGASSFTTTRGINSNYGMTSATATGGTVYYDFANCLTLPAPADGHTVQHAILGGSAGANNLLHLTGVPVNLGYAADPTYNIWCDYGATKSGNEVFPWWLPTTALGTAQNDLLTTKITNIVGTTVTFADNATNTAPGGANVWFDNAPAVAAADAASNTVASLGGGAINIPAPVEGAGGLQCLVISSPLTITSNVIQSGPVCVRGGIVTVSGKSWTGTSNDTVHTICPSNALACRIPIFLNGGEIRTNGTAFRDVAFSNVGNGFVSLFLPGQGPYLLEGVMFNSASGTDYVGVHLYEWGGVSSATTFGLMCRSCSFTTSQPADGLATAPAVVLKSADEINLDHFSGGGRTFFFSPSNPGMTCDLNMGEEWQGNNMPLFTFANFSGVGGNIAGWCNMSNIYPDTSDAPNVVNLSPAASSLGMALLIDGMGSPGAGAPLISGQPFSSISARGMRGPVNAYGQNFNIINEAPENGNLSGVRAQNYSIQPSTTAPTAFAGCNVFDLFTDNVPSWNCNNGPKIFGVGLPASVSWATSQCLQSTATVNLWTLAACPGGGGTPCVTSPLAVQFNNSGNFGCIPVPTTPNNVTQVLCSTPVGGVGTTGTFCLQGVVPDARSTTSETILASNRAGLVTFSNASPIAVTLPQAGTAGFTNNFVFNACDLLAGTATITPTPTSTVTKIVNGVVTAGASSIALTTGQCAFFYSDNTNYIAEVITSTGLSLVQTNGVSNSSQTALNFVNPATFNGLTFTFSNPSAGNETFTVGGQLANAGLLFPSTTVNGQVCTLGSTCTVSGTVLTIANAGSTGTTVNTLTKLTGAPSTAVIAATTDTGGVVGITTAGAGTTGNATISIAGQVSCVFDAATIAGDYVIISPTVAGNCHDTSAATYPTSGQVIGRVLSTNGASGTYTIDLFPPEMQGSSPALSSIRAATTTNTIANGNNGSQIWNWALTSNTQAAMTFGETTAATSGTLGNQYIAKMVALLGSTAVPLNVTNSLSGSQTLPTVHITPTWNTSGVVDAALLVNVTNTASGAASKLIDLQIGGTSQWNADKAGNTAQLGSVAFGTSPPTCAAGSGGALCLTEGTAATPVAGVDDIHADSTQHAAAVNNNNTGEMMISRSTCVNVSPVTVNANVTTDQNLITCTLPANLLNVTGRTIHIKAAGIYSTAATSTAQITIKAKLCTVSGCATGTVNTLASIQTVALGSVTVTNNNWGLDIYAVTQTAGASSVYESHGDLWIDLGSLTTAADSVFGDTNTTTTTSAIDSTGQLFLQITGAFSAASASNSMSQRQGIVEVLN